MDPFALSFLLMLGVILLEMAHLRYVRGGVIPWKEVIFNLNSGHLLMWLLRGVEVLLFTWTYRHFNLHAVDGWPGWALWIFAFVAWDFSFYWMHRLHHKLPLLWQVHVVHHQGEHFNLSLGVRNSWYSSLTSFPFVAGLAVAGVPPEVFVVVSSLHYTVQFYNHNGIVQRSGWLEHLFITPSHHRVHHGTHPLYVDRNFGGTLLLWDQLFGSFQPERADIPMRYGVVGERCGSDNPLWANNQVLHRAWRRRFNVEAGVQERPVPQAFVGLGGVLLFLLVIHFVNHQAAWSTFGIRRPVCMDICWHARPGRGVGWTALGPASLGLRHHGRSGGVALGRHPPRRHHRAGRGLAHAAWRRCAAACVVSSTGRMKPLAPLKFRRDAADEALGRALREDAKLMLAQTGDHRWADGWLLLKAVLLALVAAAMYGLALTAHTAMAFVAWFCGFFFVSMLCAMNVLHDAAHGAVFRRGWLNRLVMRMVAVPMGIDTTFWTIRHVHFHHNYANVEGHDLDIEPNAFLRQTPFHPWHPRYRHQHVHWPLVAALSLPYLIWYADSLDRLGRTPVLAHVGSGAASGAQGVSGWLVFLGFKALHVVLCLGLPAYMLHTHGLAWWLAPLAYLPGLMLASFVLVALILGTHWAEVKFYQVAQGKESEEGAAMPHSWHAHAYLTSCDWTPVPQRLGYWLGGLNWHLTHHLYPTVSHRHYPALANAAARQGEAHGLPYRNLRYGELFASQQRFLKAMGRGGEASAWVG